MGVSLLQSDGVAVLAARIGETASVPRAVAHRATETPNVGGMGRANIQQSNDGLSVHWHRILCTKMW